MNRRSLSNVCIAALVLAAGAAAQQTGPSTQQSSYMVPSDPASGVIFRSLISNGNGNSTPNELYTRLDPVTNQPIAGQSYRLVGVPDGLGAFNNDDGTFTLLMNHEIGNAEGIARAAGNTGAFVSRWVINGTPGANFMQVVGGRDADNSINLYSAGSYTTYNASNPLPTAQSFSRFCSADLAAPGAYLWTDPVTNTTYGTDARILLNGEESGAEGRAMAHIATGPEAGASYQLPWLGRMSWENAVASPVAQRNTVVIGLDDSTPGNLYVYVGERQTTGNAIERAGLANGNLYAVTMTGTTVNGSGQNVEDRTNLLGNAGSGPRPSAPFSLLNVPNPQNTTGAQLQLLDSQGQMNFLRPEDGAFNPARPNQFVFATTDSLTGNSRLWSMDFNSITNPTAGGNVTLLADGTNTASLAGGVFSATGATDIRMMDNLCFSHNGDFILVQEDVGDNARLGRVWLYDLAADRMTEIGIPDASRFLVGGANFLTQDEETSGIIDAWDLLGPGWFLLDMQAHYTTGMGGELVQGGQVMALYIPQTVPTPGAAALMGLAGLAVARRRR
ncbi:MAG: alkaline phosphatase PhoX [Phycisphaerales bacterium]